MDVNTVAMGLLLWAIALGIYFAPSWVARRNQKRNSTAIFALNLLLGWTFLGWIGALVWALKEDS